MLDRLFQQWAGEPCLRKEQLPGGGSNRTYVRLVGSTHHCVAAMGSDVRENEAFVYYAGHFGKQGLPVPEVYLFSEDHTCYLQQDLGDQNLYSWLYDRRRRGVGFDTVAIERYQQVLSDLVRFQTATKGINYSHSYPRAAFDRQSMQWDLCYFKYYFLKLAYIPFDEQLLEDDFSVFTNYLLDQHCDYFMYRDFQSRNIMLTGDERMYYIDFQGGRQGAAQYDVASLLYSASTDIPEVVRKQLLNYYLEQVSPHLAVRGERLPDFTQRFYGYVLLRIMQALGAYGYRGYYERKDHFLKSIPNAVANLRLVIQSYPLPIRLPHLEKVWQAVVESPLATAYMAPAVADCLTITVVSFSYKQGLPQDTTGNGGGYVFDCRALPNPGRYPEYRNYTGADPCVIDFLKDDDAVISFLEHAKHIVMQSVLKYKERHFSHLMVAFGCTGGQHRSVYCAEQLAFSLRQLDGCKVVLCHREQQNNKK